MISILNWNWNNSTWVYLQGTFYFKLFLQTVWSETNLAMNMRTWLIEAGWTIMEYQDLHINAPTIWIHLEKSVVDFKPSNQSFFGPKKMRCPQFCISNESKSGYFMKLDSYHPPQRLHLHQRWFPRKLGYHTGWATTLLRVRSLWNIASQFLQSKVVFNKNVKDVGTEVGSLP